jgi:hypothetical protein
VRAKPDSQPYPDSDGYLHRDTFTHTDGYGHRYRYRYSCADTNTDALPDLHEHDGYYHR